MDYLAFLSFIVATGLYWFMGPGGPLHSIDLQTAFKAKIDEQSGPNAALIWLVGIPTAAFAVTFIILEDLFGGAAMLLVGTASLFYAFGREDYPTLTQRFLARAKAGDNAGAAMVIESAGGETSDAEEDDLADLASVFFSKMAMQRWFGPIVYFFLLGPAGAVAYRLAQETQSTNQPISDSIMRIVEWLPSRLLGLSFAVFGDFDKTLGHVGGKGLSLQSSTAEFLEDAVDAASTDMSSSSLYGRVSGLLRLLERSFLLWLGVLALFVLI